jgi:beta-lactamase regulating signal transducer with metallopeptidase domain
MSGLTLHAVAQVFSERLLGSLAGGVILALVSWMVLKAIGRQSSRTRFAVWFATLAGVALLPVIGRLELRGAIAGGSAPLLRLPETWAVYLFAAWALIAVFGLVRLGAGLLQVRRLRRSSAPVEAASLDDRLRNTLEDFARFRAVTLCVSHEVRVPTAIGFRKAMVVLPEWCLRDLGAEELHAVVLHELQHLRRRDDWTNLFQQVVGALFFFHPAVWWLESRLSLEREMACDDAVIAQTANPRAYARCLVSLAEKSYLRRSVALAQAAVSRMKDMTARVTQILAPDRPAHTATLRPAVFLVAIVSTLGGATVAVAPRLVGFQEALPIGPLVAQEMSVPVVPAMLGSSRSLPVQVIEAGLKTPMPPARCLRKTPLARAVHKPGTANPAVSSANARPVLAVLRAEPQLREQGQPQAQAQPRAELVLFVMHSQQTDASGEVWNVNVVRWVLYHPPAAHSAAQAHPTKT